MLIKNPGVTVAIVITLALGVGANSAIFSLVHGVLLQPLPFKEPERIVGLRETLTGEGSIPMAYRTFAEWRDRNTVFENIAAMVSYSPNLESTDEPVRVFGMRASASYFDVMGLQPAMGRAFAPEEDRPGGQKVVVISHDLWQQRFGADLGVIGKTLRLDGVVFNIIGVMPPVSSQPDIGWASLWIPLSVDDQKERSNRGRYLRANARLKPGITLNQARTDLEQTLSSVKQSFPDTHSGNYGVDIRALEDFVVSKNVKSALLILFGVVGFVLLIACTNVANLLLARAATREKEVGIRIALGATRQRVIRQLLTESLILSLTGACVGLLLAKLGIKLLLALNLENIPRLENVGINGLVVGFTLALTLMAALVFGIAPALAATKLELSAILKEGGHATSKGPRHNRIRNVLVITEVAFALVLLIASGLMIKSYLRLRDVKPGFSLDNVLTIDLRLPARRYRERQQRVNLFRRVLEQVSSLPSVTAVSAAQSIPLRGPIYTDPVIVEGLPVPPPGQEPHIRQNIVTSGYFQTMGIPLIKGREFTEQETWDTGGAIIVNEAFARRFFPNDDPLERRIKLGNDKPWLSVVGLVANTVQDQFENKAIEEMFYPYTNPSDDLPLTFLSLVIRSTGEPTMLVGDVRSEIRRTDPSLPISNVMTMRQLADKVTAGPRFNSLLLGLFAAMALILAAVGIYGVMSYGVSQRVHEIGIRMALGAQGRDLLRVIIASGMALTFIGISIGLVGAFVFTRILQNLLYDVSGTDPITFLSVSLLLASVALLACYVPARRAMKLDPMTALRRR